MIKIALINSILTIFSLFFIIDGFSQKGKKAKNGYAFSDLIRLDATSVISQDRTGTCWSFSTTSFLESELMRMGKGEVDLSEMYQVHRIYEEKALNYVRRHGYTNFGEGSLSHDVIRSVKNYGIVPASAYSGKNYGGKIYTHGELDAVLKGMLDAIIQNKNNGLSTAWLSAYTSVLDSYLGKTPTSFEVDGKTYTPQEYANYLDINPSNYISITSFTHMPFESNHVLQIPDNWSSESYLNVPLDDFVETIDHALENGYTLAWDADVSEKSWVTKHGVAIIPEKPIAELTAEEKKNLGKVYMAEAEISQEFRQQEFDNYNTTDDHLMHIIGKARDTRNNIYYIIKNSWGEKAGIEGYQYVSLAYLKLKSIAITVHKDGLPNRVKQML